jgi:HEAT repeat protein
MVAKIFLALCVTFAFTLCGGCNEGVASRQSLDADSPSQMELKARAIIRSGLNDEDAIVRTNSIEVVATAGAGEFMPAVTKLLIDPTVAVRFTAAIAIGDMKYRPAQPVLQKIIKDTNKNVMMAASYALTRVTKTNFSTLIRNSAKSKDQTVRANAAMLLGKLGDKQDVELLYWIMTDSKSDDKARLQAAESIAMMGDEEIYRKLWTLLISKYADDRAIGIRAMGKLGTTDAVNAIVTMLMDEVPEVRLFAAVELARFGDPSGVDEITDYLESNRQRIRDTNMADVVAGMAIGYLGSDDLVEFLPGLLGSNEKQVRLSAAQSVMLLSNNE